MIDNYLLEGLVTFSQCGTLAKTADRLGVTQPAITRNMQKLEEELDAHLFKREPNRITLTETGEFAAREAQKVLQINAALATKVHNFEQNQAQVKVAANAPGPLIVLRSLKLPNVTTLPDLVLDNFAKRRDEKQVTCLLLNRPLTSATITATYLGIERMAVNLPAGSDLAGAKQLSFADLHDQTILSPRGIGFWEQIYQHRIPGSRILYQKHAHDYSDLLNYSVLPYFTTNLTRLDDNWGADLPQNRLTIPLTDQVAQQKFYACFLKENQDRLAPLIQRLQDQWATMD